MQPWFHKQRTEGMGIGGPKHCGLDINIKLIMLAFITPTHSEYRIRTEELHMNATIIVIEMQVIEVFSPCVFLRFLCTPLFVVV